MFEGGKKITMGVDQIVNNVAHIMNSPRWDAEVLSFVDEYCIYFTGVEENELHYSVYHEKFKEVVENVICDILKELSISEEQFCAACISHDKVSKVVLEQLLALDDFSTFKRLMVARNNQLEEEAIRALDKQRKPGGADCNDSVEGATTSSLGEESSTFEHFNCAMNLRVDEKLTVMTDIHLRGNSAATPREKDVTLGEKNANIEEEEAAPQICRNVSITSEINDCYLSPSYACILDGEMKLDDDKVEKKSLREELNDDELTWSETGSNNDFRVEFNASNASCRRTMVKSNFSNISPDLKKENSLRESDDINTRRSIFNFTSPCASFSLSAKQKESARVRHLDSQRRKKSIVESNDDIDAGVRRRSEHLRRQRDLIVAKKKAAREQAL